MGFIPLFLQVEGRRCLVVGGGPVAGRRLASLLTAGAAVTLISPSLSPDLQTQVEVAGVTYLARKYRLGDMQGHALVYVAIDDPELARRLYKEAQRRGIPINVSDQPEYCTFIVPAVARRGRLQIAISTEGASPALASRLRERMEAAFGPEMKVTLEVLGAARRWLRIHEEDSAARARKLRTLANSGLDLALAEGDLQAAERIVSDCLQAPLTWVDLGLAAQALSLAKAV